MVKHVLLFKFKDPEVCLETVGEKLRALAPQIPSIVSLTYGKDILGSPRSYHAALLVTFKDWEGFMEYDQAPCHNEARKYIRAHVEESHAVDFTY